MKIYDLDLKSKMKTLASRPSWSSVAELGRMTTSAIRTPREREIDTTKNRTRRRFSTAGVRLSRLDQIPMVLRHETWLVPEDTIYLFGRDAEADRYGAQVFIHVFPLPEGVQRFRRELASYRQQKKRFLVEGSKFDPSLLLPRSFSPGFERETFQSRDGAYRRRIVHIFSAPDHAVILVYSLNAARFASSVFFRHVSENLELG